MFFPFVLEGGGGGGGGEGWRLLKVAILSANLKFVRFSPLTLIPSEMSASLKMSSITAVNSLGESGSPCLTPLFIGNSSDTDLSSGSLLGLGCRCFVRFLHVLC